MKVNKMIGYFEVKGEDTLRNFAVYVLLAKHKENGSLKLYVGKTGDNRTGCNPVISRIGNHFSFNGTHSQIRNKIQSVENQYVENFDYEYFYLHENAYSNVETERSESVKKINEYERVLNRKSTAICESIKIEHLNPLGNYAKKDSCHQVDAKYEKINTFLNYILDNSKFLSKLEYDVKRELNKKFTIIN